MGGNSFGNIFKLTSFGESHGDAIGGVIEGIPAGFSLSLDKIQHELNRRRPGQSNISTPRKEDDIVQILSGIFEGKTTGMPVGFIVKNNNSRSGDYSNIKDLFRPSHADFSWTGKYGLRDYRGGGRSSAREHIARVVAGAIAKQMLEQYNISIVAYTSQVGDVILKKNIAGFGPNKFSSVKILTSAEVDSNIVRCPDETTANSMINLINEVRKDHDSIGGTVSCIISGLPIGLGEPVFDKCQALLAHAMMSINAAKGFEYGSGFRSAYMKGSEHNDEFICNNDKIECASNNSGGIQGGISNGENIYFKVAFKATPSIMKTQKTVNTDKEALELNILGRHDPCVVPRAVPVVESMAAMVILDLLFQNKLSKL